MIYHAFLNMIMLKSLKLVLKTNIHWVIVFHLVLQFYWFVSSAGDNGEVDLVGLREEVVQRGRLWGGQFSHVPNIPHLPKLPKLPCVPEFAGGELGGWGWWCDEGWWDGSRGGRMWKASWGRSAARWWPSTDQRERRGAWKRSAQLLTPDCVVFSDVKLLSSGWLICQYEMFSWFSLYPLTGRGRPPPRSLKRGRRQERGSKDASKLLLLYDDHILDNDPMRESKDMAFAQAYLNRVSLLGYLTR